MVTSTPPPRVQSSEKLRRRYTASSVHISQKTSITAVLPSIHFATTIPRSPVLRSPRHLPCAAKLLASTPLPSLPRQRNLSPSSRPHPNRRNQIAGARPLTVRSACVWTKARTTILASPQPAFCANAHPHHTKPAALRPASDGHHLAQRLSRIA